MRSISNIDRKEFADDIRSDKYLVAPLRNEFKAFAPKYLSKKKKNI